MLLWLGEWIKVPETGLDKVVGWHFRETHLEENLTIFRSDLGYKALLSLIPKAIPGHGKEFYL